MIKMDRVEEMISQLAEELDKVHEEYLKGFGTHHKDDSALRHYAKHVLIREAKARIEELTINFPNPGVVVDHRIRQLTQQLKELEGGG